MTEKMLELASRESMASGTDKNEHGNVSIRAWSCSLDDHMFCNRHSPLACLGVNGLTMKKTSLLLKRKGPHISPPGIIPRRFWSSGDKGCEGKHYRSSPHKLALFVICPEGLSSTESS